MTKGSESAARRLLENHNFEIRRSDANLIAFFGGIGLVLLLFGAYFFFIPTYDEKKWDLNYVIVAALVLRITWMLFYIILATGFAIHVFNLYNINYLYIFECDPRYKVNHW